MNTVAALAAIVVVLGAIHVAAEVIVPLLAAVCLTIAFEPVARVVSARGWRPAITALVTVGVDRSGLGDRAGRLAHGVHPARGAGVPGPPRPGRDGSRGPGLLEHRDVPELA